MNEASNTVITAQQAEQLKLILAPQAEQPTESQAVLDIEEQRRLRRNAASRAYHARLREKMRAAGIISAEPRVKLSDEERRRHRVESSMKCYYNKKAAIAALQAQVAELQAQLAEKQSAEQPAEKQPAE